ncbi:MAG: hypothetical protein AAFR65_03730 [Pseudomonadota bacterium]
MIIRAFVVAVFGLMLSGCVTSDITDSQYVVVFDTVSCSGDCRLGDVQFGVIDGDDRTNQRRSEVFEIESERAHRLNFGFRFDGLGVRYEMIFADQNEQFTLPLTVERDGSVRLNGPQRRSFSRQFARNNEPSVFVLTYYIYRADP